LYELLRNEVFVSGAPASFLVMANKALQGGGDGRPAETVMEEGRMSPFSLLRWKKSPSPESRHTFPPSTAEKALVYYNLSVKNLSYKVRKILSVVALFNS
jgi:hypothetical protein